MCPSQLIQAEDVIIYQSLGLGRNFCQRERREGMRECKRVKRRKCPAKQPVTCSTSVSHKCNHAIIISKHCALQIVSDTCVFMAFLNEKEIFAFNFFIIRSLACQLSKHVQLEEVRLMPGFLNFETIFHPSRLWLLLIHLPSILLLLLHQDYA